MIMILSRERNMIASAAQRACRQPRSAVQALPWDLNRFTPPPPAIAIKGSASAASRTDFRGFRCRNLAVGLVPSGLLELSLTAQPLSSRQSTSI